MSKLITSKIEYQHKYLLPVLTEQFGTPHILKANATKEEIKTALDKHKIVQCETANGLTFSGRYHSQKKKATIIVQTPSGRQIAFRTEKNGSYKAIIEDYHRHDEAWKNLGVNYVKATLKSARARHRFRTKELPKIKDKHGRSKKAVIELSR